MRTFALKPKATQQTTSAKSTIPGRGQFGQSPEVRSILHLQRTIGNQAVQRMLQTDAGQPEAELNGPASPRFGHDFNRIPIHPPAAGAIQTKLAINKLGDSYEQEADRMAEQVMRTPEPQLQLACPCSGGCPKCTEQPGRERESLQTKHVQASDSGQIAAPPIVHEVLRSPGQPLDPATRAFMEPRFGYDFSRVQVHLGGAAEKSARDVNAHAYTVGHDIVFGASRFEPEAHEGRRLIAHELAHVVQQQKSQATIQRQPAKGGGSHSISNPAIDEVYDQLDIIREGQLPLEFYRRKDIRGLSFGERQDMEFKRKWEAILKLGDLRDQRAVFTLVAVLEDKIFPIQGYSPAQQLLLKQAAAESLGKIGGKVSLSKLTDLLKSKDPQDRKMAAGALPGVTGGQAATDLLTALQAETDADLKAKIIFALGNAAIYLANMKERQAIEAELIRQMEKDKDMVRLAAVNALGKLRLKSATEPLLKLLANEHDVEPLAAEIVNALGEIGDKRAVDLVVIMLRVHVKKRVRIEAALALGKIGGSKAQAALKDRLNLEADADVKAAIFKAMTPVIHQTFRSAESLP